MRLSADSRIRVVTAVHRLPNCTHSSVAISLHIVHVFDQLFFKENLQKHFELVFLAEHVDDINPAALWSLLKLPIPRNRFSDPIPSLAEWHLFSWLDG